MKKYKNVIFWIVFIAMIYIAITIGENSINPLKWNHEYGGNYCYGDNLHDMPIITRLIGVASSLFILTFLLAIIGWEKDV